MFEPPKDWITVDVGETTGWARWNRSDLIDTGQTPLWKFVYNVGFALLGVDVPVRSAFDAALFDRLRPWELMVIEDWSLYEDQAMALVGDKQDTVRGLGALQFICDALGRPYKLQGASIKNQAELGGSHELYRKPLHPNRHMNDAIDHGVYYQAYLKGESLKAQRKLAARE